MKILHCVPNMGGGGTERQLVHLVGGLVRRGCEVHVALVDGGPNLSALQASGAVVHTIPASNNYDPRVVARLIKLIRQVQPLLVQTWLGQMDIFGGLAARWTGTPHVLSERSSAVGYGSGWKVRWRLQLGRRAAGILANSEGGRAYWSGAVAGCPPIKVIRNIIDFQGLANAAAVSADISRLPPESEVIVFAGRYNESEKNVLNLLQALVLVLDARPNATAVMFGHGPLREALLAEQTRHQCGDRLRIEGFTSELWSWLKRADVMVSVSYFEGTPNTVLEAVAAQCPVVVSDIPAHRELLDESCAWFVPPTDQAAIARGLIACMADRAEARRRAARARDRIGSYSAEAVTEEHIRAYCELLGLPSGAA